MNYRSMIILIGSAALVSSITGCGGGGSDSSATPAGSNPSTTSYTIPPLSTGTKQDYLNAINNARTVQQDCGVEGIKPAVPALVWNDKLYSAAAEHSNDMAKSDTFSHTGSGTQSDWTSEQKGLGRGSTVTERIENSGYDWQRNGENIAAGTNLDTVDAVIQEWLNSAGHCANLMNPDFKDVGMAMAEDANSKYIHYWTQDFGTLR